MSQAVMEVHAEPVAEKVTYKSVPPPRGGRETVVEFDLQGLKQHEDYFMKLDVGKGSSLRVSVGFPDPVRKQLRLGRARVNFYASFKEQSTPVKYRYQAELEEGDSDDREVVYEWSAVEGMVTFAAFSTSPLDRLVVECVVGASVRSCNDLSHIWKICSLPTPSIDDVADVKRWLWERHTDLLLDGGDTDGTPPTLIYDDSGKTPFHRLCESLGEPTLCALLLREYGRLVDPALPERDTGGTALHLLARNRGLRSGEGGRGDFRYRRALDLAEALLAAGCSVSTPDNDGNTPLHLACANFAGGVEFLQAMLRSATRDLEAKNAAGRTPLEAYNHSPGRTRDGYELLKDAFESALKIQLVAAPTASPATAHGSLMRGPPPSGMSTGTNAPPNSCPETFTRCEVTGHPLGLDEGRLAAEFRRYDVNGDGVLSREEVRRVYKEYESFGICPSDAEVDTLLNSLGILSDGKVTLKEFAVLLLHLEARS